MLSKSESPNKCVGQYHDGFTAKIQPVVLELAGTNLALKDSDGNLVRHWRCDSIRIVEQLAGRGYRLALDSGERQQLVVEHPDAIALIDHSCSYLRSGDNRKWLAGKPILVVGFGLLLLAVVTGLLI